MKDKLLIINKESFGTITDCYKWCQYLRDEYDITFICLESPRKDKVYLKGVNVKYVKCLSSYLLRGLYYIFYVLFYICFFRGKIMVVYFEHCEILKFIFPFKKMNLDIRTLSISNNVETNNSYNKKLRKVCHYFDSITIISHGILEKLHLKNSNTFILPLGADSISNLPKNFSSIKLLYVGTLTNRNIDLTVRGLSIFCQKYPNAQITYDVVGDGDNNELQNIKSLIKELQLDHIVTCHGYLPYSTLPQFFDKCNVGVSFVPLTDYYNHQPVTKTYEYILSGLYTIATETFENRKVINSNNGITIKDSVMAFAEALEYVYNNKFEFHDKEIRASLATHTWKSIVDQILKGILLHI